MSRLLQSKKFRRNLCKWLFMYVGCIALLTTVVTYSRYMSTIQSSDSARVAKFAIDVTSNEKCSSTITEYCNQEAYRATSDINYYFTVDTTELEVKTQLFITLYINKNFTLYNNIVEISEDGTKRNVTIDTSPSDATYGDYNLITIKNDELTTIEAGKGSKKVYQITVRYNKDNYTEFAGIGDIDIIKVAYSAVQLAK